MFGAKQRFDSFAKKKVLIILGYFYNMDLSA